MELWLDSVRFTLWTKDESWSKWHFESLRNCGDKAQFLILLISLSLDIIVLNFFSIYFLEHEKKLLISDKNERKIDKIKYCARRWKGLFRMVGKLLKEEMSQRGT